MTQLAAGSRSEAETLHAAVRAYARPHLDTAASLAAQLHNNLVEIAEHLPDGVPEKVHVAELAVTLARYAALLGYEAEPADDAGLAPTLGLAKRVAVQAINEAADRLVDASVLEWAQGIDLPVMDITRIVDAALVASAALTHKRALGLELTELELAQEMGLQLLQARQVAVRAAQRDHVRIIDTLGDVDTVREYPALAVWPE
jgi:hypothetical protein